MNFQFFVILFLIAGFVLPSFGLAQTTQPPQTMGEVQSLGLNILNRLPGAIKDVWQTQALPIWLNIWRLTKNLWESSLGAKVEFIWQKFLGLLGKESPDIKVEFQKESQEMQQDLWSRFWDLLK